MINLYAQNYNRKSQYNNPLSFASAKIIGEGRWTEKAAQQQPQQTAVEPGTQVSPGQQVYQLDQEIEKRKHFVGEAIEIIQNARMIIPGPKFPESINMTSVKTSDKINEDTPSVFIMKEKDGVYMHIKTKAPQTEQLLDTGELEEEKIKIFNSDIDKLTAEIKKHLSVKAYDEFKFMGIYEPGLPGFLDRLARMTEEGNLSWEEGKDEGGEFMRTNLKGYNIDLVRHAPSSFFIRAAKDDKKGAVPLVFNEIDPETGLDLVQAISGSEPMAEKNTNPDIEKAYLKRLGFLHEDDLKSLANYLEAEGFVRKLAQN